MLPFCSGVAPYHIPSDGNRQGRPPGAGQTRASTHRPPPARRRGSAGRRRGDEQPIGEVPAPAAWRPASAVALAEIGTRSMPPRGVEAIGRNTEGARKPPSLPRPSNGGTRTRSRRFPRNARLLTTTASGLPNMVGSVLSHLGGEPRVRFERDRAAERSRPSSAPTIELSFTELGFHEQRSSSSSLGVCCWLGVNSHADRGERDRNRWTVDLNSGEDTA